MNLELNIKLYESASGKQNMWIEKIMILELDMKLIPLKMFIRFLKNL